MFPATSIQFLTQKDENTFHLFLCIQLYLSIFIGTAAYKYYCQSSKQNIKSPNKQVTYLGSVVLSRKRADTLNKEEKKLYIMTPSCQFRQTRHVEGEKKKLF